jgi:hypothetical protein
MMSRFWIWLLSHLSVLVQRNGVLSMQMRLRMRQRTQEQQLADARRRVQFLRDQTALRGAGKPDQTPPYGGGKPE